MKTLFPLLLAIAGISLAQESIERLDPAVDAILSPDAQIETLCQGFDWVEGPVWDAAGKRLLFSDVPRNRIYQWMKVDAKGKLFATGPGSVLILDPTGKLLGRILCTRPSASVESVRAEKRLSSPRRTACCGWP